MRFLQIEVSTPEVKPGETVELTLTPLEPMGPGTIVVRLWERVVVSIDEGDDEERARATTKVRVRKRLAPGEPIRTSIRVPPMAAPSGKWGDVEHRWFVRAGGRFTFGLLASASVHVLQTPLIEPNAFDDPSVRRLRRHYRTWFRSASKRSRALFLTAIAGLVVLASRGLGGLPLIVLPIAVFLLLLLRSRIARSWKPPPPFGLLPAAISMTRALEVDCGATGEPLVVSLRQLLFYSGGAHTESGPIYQYRIGPAVRHSIPSTGGTVRFTFPEDAAPSFLTGKIGVQWQVRLTRPGDDLDPIAATNVVAL